MTSRFTSNPAVSLAVGPRRESEPPLRANGSLDIARREVGGTVVIAAVGEVDLDTASVLREAVIACFDDAGPCVLDLTGVTFLGSVGLTALLEATIHTEAHREPLPIVVDANRPVIRPIQVTGVDAELTLYHTVDEALKASTPSR